MTALLGYVLILIYSFCGLAEGMIVKKYAKEHEGGGMLMNAIIALFAMVFFLVADLAETGALYFPPALFFYGAIGAVLYFTGFYLTFVAFKIGSFGLTKLISSFALLFPIGYGLFFLNEEATFVTYIGIACILASLFLINFKKKSANEKQKDKKLFSFKWLLCILVSTLANGFISILTRIQQIRFDNACSNEFLILSLGGAFVLLLGIGLVTDRSRLAHVLKTGSLYGGLAGLCNGAKNFLTIFIYLCLPLSVVSPITTGLSILFSFLVAIMLYKEKYSLIQKCGVLLGAAAVLLLTVF